MDNSISEQVDIIGVRHGEAAPDAGARIEVELASGHRPKVQGGFDRDALAALIRTLLT